MVTVPPSATALSGLSDIAEAGLGQGDSLYYDPSGGGHFRNAPFVLNAKAYGVVGGGVVDDYAKAQALIDFACQQAYDALVADATNQFSGAGWEIFFPADKYKLSTTLHVWFPCVSIRGAGRQATMLFLADGTANTVDLLDFCRNRQSPGANRPTAPTAGSYGHYLRDLMLCTRDANANTGRDLLVVENLSEFDCHNVTIKNAGRYGINAKGLTTSRWDNFRAWNCQSGGFVIDSTAISNNPSTCANFSGCRVTGTIAGHGWWFKTLYGGELSMCVAESTANPVSPTDPTGDYYGMRFDDAEVLLDKPYFEANKSWDIDISAVPAVPPRIAVKSPSVRLINGGRFAGCRSIRVQKAVSGGLWGGYWNDATGGVVKILAGVFNWGIYNPNWAITSANIDYDSAGGHTLKDYPGTVIGFDSDGNGRYDGGNIVRVWRAGRLLGTGGSGAPSTGLATAYEVGDVVINGTMANGSPWAWVCVTAGVGVAAVFRELDCVVSHRTDEGVGVPGVGQRAGGWFRGDKRWNSNPASGQPIGWMCTASGDPGTWLAMPNL